MRNILSLTLLLCSVVSFAQTRIDATINVDSVERQFIISKPSGAPPPGGYPVVVMLHGSGQSGQELYQYSGWKAKGEQENILTVFPSSLEYCIEEDGKQKTSTKWNNAEFKSIACPGQNLKDDVKFIRMMLDTIIKTAPIDQSRIYASGFSNGGGMVSKLAIEMSDIFAALASHAGGLSSADSGLAKRKIPFTYSIGSDDDQSFNYGLSSFPFNDSCLYVHRALINRYLSVLGLGQDYTKDSLGVILHYRFNSLGVAATWEFNYVMMKGLEHEYPKSGSYPVGAVDMLWPFFQQYTLPLGVKKNTEDALYIPIRPNPATDYIIVDEDATVTLFSSTGAEVFTTKTLQDERIALPKLSSGVYIAKIETTSGIKTAKVIVR